MTTYPDPFDPKCGRPATEMTDYDLFIAEEEDIRPDQVTPEMRAGYVHREEGTYNPENGHFLCDQCYIEAGMPSSPSGWVCP